MSGRMSRKSPMDYSRSDCITCGFYTVYSDMLNIRNHEVTRPSKSLIESQFIAKSMN